MRISGLKYAVLTWSSILAMLLIALVPFQGFLTVFGADLIGHYTVLRLWDEAGLGLIVLGSLYLFITDRKIREHTLQRRLSWLIFGYIALNILLGVIAHLDHNVTLKALGYGLIVNLRYLVFLLSTWALSLRLSKLRNNWQKIVIWPTVIVIIFGLLQIMSTYASKVL